jgi:hypothetical protein
MINEEQKQKIRNFLQNTFSDLPAITTRRELLTFIREYLNSCEEMIDRNEPKVKKEKRSFKTA